LILNNALIVLTIAKYVIMLPLVNSVMKVTILTVTMNAQNVIFIVDPVPQLHQIVPHAIKNISI
jgi:hypothetical protein